MQNTTTTTQQFLVLEELTPLILSFLPQRDLFQCLLLCKSITSLIQSNKLLRLQLFRINSFSQFKNYVKVGRIFYQKDFYSDVLQESEVNLTEERLSPEDWKVTSVVKQNENTIVNYNPKGAGRFSSVESSMLLQPFGHYFYEVEPGNYYLTLLCVLREYLNNPTNAGNLQSLPFLLPNGVKAIKILLKTINSDPDLQQILKVRLRENKFFGKVLDEDSYVESDEEDYQPPKIPTELLGTSNFCYYCKKCKWKLSSIVCKTRGCGSMLTISEGGVAICPKGCGGINAPECNHRPMRVIAHKITASTGSTSMNSAPPFGCQCGFVCTAPTCYTCNEAGTSLIFNGALRRMGGISVFSCANGYGRKLRGGIYNPSNFYKCHACSKSQTGRMPPKNTEQKASSCTCS